MTPDLDEAVEFMRGYCPDGLWVPCGINPLDKRAKLPTDTFKAENGEVMFRHFVQELHNNKHNVYFHAHEPNERVRKRMRRQHVRLVRAAWVDIDPKDPQEDWSLEEKQAWLVQERKRILDKLTVNRPAEVPPASIIIDSGGGYQAGWTFHAPIELLPGWTKEEHIRQANHASRFAKRLCQIFDGADSCFSADHLFRLPGSINICSPDKLAKGRQPARARLLREHTDFNRKYHFDELPQPLPEHEQPRKATAEAPPLGEAQRIDDLSMLDKWKVTDRLKFIIATGKGEKPKPGDNSRSAWLCDVVWNLRRKKVPREAVLGLITDKAWGISESVLEASDPLKYATKQIDAADATLAAEFEINTKTGKPFGNLRNVELALGKMNITLSYDLFAHKVMIEGLPEFGPELDDDGVNRLKFKMERLYEVAPHKGTFHDMCRDISLFKKFHPVCDILYKFQAERDQSKNILHNWMHVYLGVEDNEYSQEVGRLALLALVRRVRVPGCKYDEMPILECLIQGTDKSTFLRTLAIKDEWFTDNFPLGRPTKEAIELTTGKLVIECPELEGLTANKVENVKGFLSRQEDSARAAYGRIRKDVKRQYTLWGTTNHNQYLFDMTGNRRMWPLTIGEIKLEEFKRDLPQLLGEAAALEATGASIRMKKELWAVAAEEQDARLAPHPWVELIGNAIGDREGVIQSSEIWTLLGINAKDLQTRHTSELGKCMQALGWKYKKVWFNGRKVGCYVKGLLRNVIEFPRQMYNHEDEQNTPF